MVARDLRRSTTSVNAALAEGYVVYRADKPLLKLALRKAEAPRRF